ncbi:hypothetical protein MPSEU_000793600 [Mayamaea pseudoterrestris]|nr:hypothetical protein MPSEU_000793600 [Mayamaea pseudoterrestris]
MKEIQLFLVPEPGKKPEFLATVIPIDPAPIALKQWQTLPSKIVLEAYTRDAWAWKPNSKLQAMSVKSTDGRNKLPGFVGYLKQRQKSAYGRFPTRGVLIVSYIQSSKETDRMDCTITMDFADLPNCELKPMPAAAQQQQQAAAIRPSLATATVGKKTGLLGKLVSGAQRTQQSMLATAKSNVQPIPTASINDNQVTNSDTAIAASNASEALTRTAQQVLAEFRESMQQRMLDFELAPDECTRIELSLPEYIAGLNDDEKPRVTMDVLKYMVYEAAEEVDEEWIAYKEPSEFMDECVITVYKEGAAPPEVLEETNRAELPEEVRGQERAIAQERQRQLERQQMQQQKFTQNQAHKQHISDEADELEALNTHKRDRRTIEDYERERRAR